MYFLSYLPRPFSKSSLVPSDDPGPWEEPAAAHCKQKQSIERRSDHVQESGSDCASTVVSVRHQWRMPTALLLYSAQHVRIAMRIAPLWHRTSTTSSILFFWQFLLCSFPSWLVSEVGNYAWHVFLTKEGTKRFIILLDVPCVILKLKRFKSVRHRISSYNSSFCINIQMCKHIVQGVSKIS